MRKPLTKISIERIHLSTVKAFLYKILNSEILRAFSLNSGRGRKCLQSVLTFATVLNVLVRLEKRWPTWSRRNNVTWWGWALTEEMLQLGKTLLKLGDRVSIQTVSASISIAAKKNQGRTKATLKTVHHQWPKLKDHIHGKWLSSWNGKSKSFGFYTAKPDSPLFIVLMFRNCVEFLKCIKLIFSSLIDTTEGWLAGRTGKRSIHFPQWKPLLSSCSQPARSA